MAKLDRTPHRVVIVGGGFAGLSIAARLAQSAVPVTLLEAADLGFEASSRNQGWLYSGAWFAREHAQLAEMCHQSLLQTLAFCPECLEPQHEGMAYLISRPETLAEPWVESWRNVGLDVRELNRDELKRQFPAMDLSQVQHAFLLPDRSMRPQMLLEKLAATAQNAGAEIRTKAAIVRLLVEDDTVVGVETAGGEQLRARLVILATGPSGAEFWSQILPAEPGGQLEHRLVTLKSHLLSIKPHVGLQPFCVVDRGGFNHLPHAPRSVFGSNLWTVVSDAADRQVEENEVERIWEEIRRLFPTLNPEECESSAWAGTTVHAMHLDQIEPGRAPLPTVINHADQTPPLHNLLSAFTGRATLWPQLAESTRTIVMNELNTNHKPATTQPPWAEGSQ